MKLEDSHEFTVEQASPQGGTAAAALRSLLIAVAAQRIMIAVCAAVLLLAGGVLLWRKAPTYTARALLVVENTRLEVGRQELLPESGMVDTSAVDSQVEILRAEAIGLKVIGALKLAPEIPGETAAAASAGDAPAADLAFLPSFQGRLAVRRVGLSSVIEVSYKADTPAQAAQVVNAVTDTYLANQAAAAAAAASTASAWLRERIRDLGAKTRVVSAAIPPAHPDGPRRLFVLAGFGLLGLLLGVGAATLRHALRPALWDPAFAASRIGARFLGALLKAAPGARTLPLWTAVSSTGTLEADFLALARGLRATLNRRQGGGVVGVAAAGPHEGATTVALGLARAAAADGQRVLLVDGNPFQAELSARFAPAAETGLVDFIASAGEIHLHWTPSDLPGLDVVPVGGRVHRPKDRDGASLRRGLMRPLIAHYDLILVDLPPLTAAPDLGPARSVVDHVLLVVEWGGAPASVVEEAIEAAGLGPARLVGFIFNKVRWSALTALAFPSERRRWRRGPDRDYSPYDRPLTGEPAHEPLPVSRNNGLLERFVKRIRLRARL